MDNNRHFCHADNAHLPNMEVFRFRPSIASPGDAKDALSPTHDVQHVQGARLAGVHYPRCLGASVPPRCIGERSPIDSNVTSSASSVPVFVTSSHRRVVYFGIPLPSRPVISRSRYGCTWNRTGVIA